MAPETNAQPENSRVGALQSTQNIPSSWPGAFHIYRYSAQAVRCNIWLLIEIWVVYYAIDVFVRLIRLNTYAELLLSLLVIILGIATAVLTTAILIAGTRGKHLTASEALSGPLPLLTLKMLALNIIVSIAYAVSALALVIPFFFVFPRLTLASYFLVDKNMGPLDAFKASWLATKGNSGKVWGIVGVGFLMALLMITIIGIPVAIYLLVMYSGAYAVLYEMIDIHTLPASANAAPATPQAA